MLLAAIVTLVGATLQSATGFGFALVLGPALFAVLEPAEALTTLLILGALLNLLVLFAERSRPQVLPSELGVLLASAAPGIVAGALLLSVISKPPLQVVVGVAVVLAGLFQARRGFATAPDSRPRTDGWLAAPVGLAAGTLTTTTSTNGPPLVLWYQRLGSSPAELRDSVAAASLALNAVGAVTLALVVGPEQSLDLGTIAVLVPLVVIGHLAGKRLFESTRPEHFRAAGLALVVAAGAASIVAGVSS